MMPELQLDAMAGLGAADCSAAGRILKARELEIASQDTTEEMHPSAHCEADFEAAYDRCIKVAREAQAAHAR